MIPSYLPLSLTFVSLAFLPACSDEIAEKVVNKLISTTTSTHSFSSSSDNPDLPVAIDAAEWTTRFTKNASSIFPAFDNLFAELPEKAEWPAITSHLASLKIEDFKDLYSANDRELAVLKAQFLQATLSGEPLLAPLRAALEKSDDPFQSSREHLFAALVQFGNTPEEAGAFLTEKFGKPKQSTRHRSAKKPWQIDLAKGDVEEGINKLWQLVDEEKGKPNQLDPLARLAKLGKLLERPDLEAKALSKAIEVIKALTTNSDQYLSAYRIVQILQHLGELERWDEVKSLSLGLLKRQGTRGRSTMHSKEDILVHYLSAVAETEGADAFMVAFNNSGGCADSVIFLSILRESSAFALRVVDALPAEDQAALLKYLIAADGGEDAFYRRLIAIEGQAAEPFFDQLLDYDPYEERPLIWKGSLALDRGDLLTARGHVDAAIKLDPSDGDQGKDSRMEVYNVLSRVLHAEGDEEKAMFFTEVTTAIRLGEMADDYLYAGLTDEAVRRYREALGRFEDAYCLQSRLAKTLLDQGDVAGAVVHFEKAFTLMPVSFGPVESHCFGCEGIFDSREAQEVAERVFGKLLEEAGDNPRTHYLLGLLYTEMKRPDQAFELFVKAFELDPDYYNSAKKIESHLTKHPALRAEHAELTKRLLAITPYADLPYRLKERCDLVPLWDDAKKLSEDPLPLELPPLPLPEELPLPQQTGKTFDLSSVSPSNSVRALHGWNREDLLRDNRFLQAFGRLRGPR